MSQFPSEEEFNQNKETKDNLMKWRDVPVNIILKINKVDRIETQYGIAVILTLENVENKIFKCWSNQMLADELKDFGWREEECYVKSLGMVTSMKNPSRKYFSYNLCWEKQQRYDTVN